MSKQLLQFTKEYLEKNPDTQFFVDEYIDRWKRERDDGTILKDAPQLGEALSSIFCAADNYCAYEDRQIYEFDEKQLQEEIKSILKRFGME